MHNNDLFGFTEKEIEEMERMLKDSFEKALKEDPFYNPELRKKKPKKEAKPKKGFEGYNWTTLAKVRAGLRKKIRELKDKKTLTEKEKMSLKRMQRLLKWHNEIYTLHKAGRSDRWIHAEMQRRKAKAKAST